MTSPPLSDSVALPHMFGKDKTRRLHRRLHGIVLVIGAGALILSVTGVSDASTPTSATASRWTAVEGPVPTDAAAVGGMYLSSLACPSAGSCTAVGNYEDTSSHAQGVIERLTKGKSSVAEAPLPTNAATNPRVSFSSVACPSTSSCVAVGWYDDASGDTESLIEMFSKGSWSASTVALPENGNANSSSSLATVVCTSDSSCDAVGSYSDASPSVSTSSETGSAPESMS